MVIAAETLFAGSQVDTFSVIFRWCCEWWFVRDPVILPAGVLLHCRDMRCDHFPASSGKLDPGLGLPADVFCPSDLELKVNRRKAITQRQNLQTSTLFFDAGSFLSRNPVLMNFIKSVAVFVHGVTDCVFAVPESVIQYFDILVDRSEEHTSELQSQ